MAKADVSLCTVATPLHKRMLGLNHQLVGRLNPDTAVEWLVTENADLHMAKGGRQHARFETEPLKSLVPGARILPGPTLEEVHEEELGETAGPEEAERRRLLDKYLGSYHHAAALDLAMAEVRTRYAIIMDPDFYVVRPGWIDEVLARMNEEDLSLFGAPWSPRWYQKYRNFACTHLMVVDLEKRPWTPGLLGPDLVGGGRRWASPIWTEYARRLIEEPSRARGYLLLRLPLAIFHDLRQRKTIGASRDTGYYLAKAALDDPDMRAELVTSVFAPEDGFMPAAVSLLQCWPMLEGLLPDEKRYLPRRGVSAEGFVHLFYPDFRAKGWEEFLWQGEPFAFHVRGEMHRRPTGGVDPQTVGEALEQVMHRLGMAPLAQAQKPRRRTRAAA